MKTQIYWTPAKTWDVVLAELTLANFYATVFIDPNASVIMGPGSYNFQNVQFVSIASYAYLDMPSGVRLDAGPAVYLQLSNVILTAEGELMVPGTKDVNLSLNNSILSNYGSGMPLFATSSDNNSITLINSSIGIDAGGGPILSMTDAGAYLACIVASGFPELPAIYTVVSSTYVIDGVAGTQGTLVSAPLSAAGSPFTANTGAIDAFNPAINLGVYFPAASLTLPNVPSVYLPNGSLANTGLLLWNLIANGPQYSDGTQLVNFSALPPYPQTGRPAAGSVKAGTGIFNTTSNVPNYADGAGNWRDPSGSIV